MQLASALAQLPPGRPRLLSCAEPQLTLLRLRRGPLERGAPAARRVAVSWAELPGLRDQISSVLQSFAELALAMHPDWAHAAAQRINRVWREQAEALCRHGQLPLVARCAPAEQLHQLALTLGEELVVLLVIDRVAQPAGGLAAVTRVAEWVARATGLRVGLLVPASLAGHSELARIAYQHVELDAPAKTPAAQRRPGCTAELWPVEGRPHPKSPGELLLAAALAAAPELRGLFAFNQRVRTVTGAEYLVDVLWKAGRLVVEVDGYQYHSRAEHFAEDRERDYALLISGFRVLRLTSTEVCLNTATALAKIRAAVAFVQRAGA